MRKNKPQNLNEQLSRMKRLMNFDIGEHSHDKLTEQEYKKIVTEQLTPQEREERYWANVEAIKKTTTSHTI